MKKTVVGVLVAMLAFTGFAQANDAVLEQVMLLRFAEEADVSEYSLVEILQGYAEYRAMMDDLAADRAEACAALTAAVAADEDSSKLMSLTRELMDIDMNILETQQSAINEAGSVLGNKAVAEMYLLVSDMDKAKANLVAQLSGTPASCCANCPMAGTAACPMAAQASAAAPAAAVAAAPAAAVKPEEAIMERVMVFLNKLVAKDLDGAMAAVADDFEHYDFKTKADLRTFLEDAIATGYLDDVEIQTEDTEVKIDGAKAVVYPVDIVGMFGTVTLELVGETRDGIYMLTTIDAFGI